MANNPGFDAARVVQRSIDRLNDEMRLARMGNGPIRNQLNLHMNENMIVDREMQRLYDERQEASAEVLHFIN